MEIYGNKVTYNVENVLRQNIVNSEYFRNDCMKLASWGEVIDQIYYNVEDVEPWMSGNARGASSAFCLMYRLCTLQMTEEEIRQTITHEDSPYIRAVGFLYLRYVCDPKNLWQWCSRYVRDHEEFTPSPGGKPVTIGDFVRDILLEQYYFETIFPRIPKLVSDDIIANLKQMGLPTVAKGNGGAGGGDRRGVDDGNRRPASVKASLSVAFGQRAPNRAGAREEGRGRDPSLHTREANRERAAAGRPEPPTRRYSPPPRDRSREVRPRSRTPDRGYRGHDHRGARDERPRSGRARSPELDARGDRRRSRERSRDRGSRHARDSRSPVRRRRPSRSRSRSREGRREEGRDVRSVFRDAAAADVRAAADLKSKYGDASGPLFDRPSGAATYRTEEVLRIGGSRR